MHKTGTQPLIPGLSLTRLARFVSSPGSYYPRDHRWKCRHNGPPHGWSIATRVPFKERYKTNWKRVWPEMVLHYNSSKIISGVELSK